MIKHLPRYIHETSDFNLTGNSLKLAKITIFGLILAAASETNRCLPKMILHVGMNTVYISKC